VQRRCPLELIQEVPEGAGAHLGRGGALEGPEQVHVVHLAKAGEQRADLILGGGAQHLGKEDLQ